jgi:CDP-glycerol glycerophosphotransferase
MSKLSNIKELVYKQKVEFDKPKVMYQNNKNFQTVVDYTEFYNNEKIKSDTILVIGNNGKTRNIKQLLELLTKKYSNKKIIFADECDENKTNNHNENQIQFISKESKKYLKVLTNSKIIITYEQLPTYFIRKNNQKVIQLSDFFTGKFTENNQFDARTVSLQRSLFQTTHILFKNNLEADMYINIFNLKNIYKGNVYKNVNFYFPSDELIDNFKDDLLIITKKYSQKEMSLIIAKANIYLNDYFIYVEPSLYDYYRKFNGLEFLIIKNEVSKEDLHLHNLKIMSDNYSDLIGVSNYHFSLEEPNIFVNHIKKQLYLSNFKVIENILNDKEEGFVNIYSEDKKNILMYCGGFLNNGITSSAINLSNSIDYNNYNLIIIDKGNLGEEERENMKRLNSKANIVYRVGQSNVNFSEFRKNQFVISRRGYRNFLGKKELRNFYQGN